MLQGKVGVLRIAVVAAVWAIGFAADHGDHAARGAPAVPGADLTLVDNGKAAATIVVPDEEEGVFWRPSSFHRFPCAIRRLGPLGAGDGRFQP